MTGSPDLLFERIRSAAASEYEVVRQIGAGGMATVYLARDVVLDRPVAIKVMRPELIDVERVQDRFLIEARTAAQLGHHGIVTVYAIKQNAGLIYIVMRYIEGRTLDDVLREQAIIDPSTTASIIARVADALHFAHGRGIVHRDVKPSNILMDAGGEPFVTDFGIARVSTRPGITMAGSMLGTPTYMSPEQCRGMPVTAASDQYSLGVMTYQLLAGRTPFTGEFFELIEAHKSQAPPPLNQFVAGIDPGIESTVMRMLAKEPAERWESLADVAHRFLMASASPREFEQMQAMISFIGPPRGVGTTPLPGPKVETPPDPTPVAMEAEGPPSISILETPEEIAPADTPPPGALEVATPSFDVEPTPPRFGRALLVSAAVLSILVVALTVIWSQRRSSVAPIVVPADTLVTRGTVPPPAVVQPASSTPPRDTIPAVVKTSPDSATAAAETKKKSATPQPRGQPIDCARLLERVSLGEKLTGQEEAALKGRCRK